MANNSYPPQLTDPLTLTTVLRALILTIHTVANPITDQRLIEAIPRGVIHTSPAHRDLVIIHATCILYTLLQGDNNYH